MMKKLFNLKSILAATCLMSCAAVGNAQVFDWVVGMGGSKPDYAYATAVDHANNVYVTGSFTDTATFRFGEDTLVSRGNSDVFLAKFDPAGNLVWVKGMGGTNADAGQAVTTDPQNGDVIVAGYIGIGKAYFNLPDTTADTITSAGSNDIFLARYDASGNIRWVKRFGGTGADDVRSVVVDKAGDIYISGDFKSATAYFNPGVAGSGELTINGSTSKPNADAYIAKYDANGNFLWVHKIGGTAADYGGQVAVDGANNVYLVGWFSSANSQFDASGNAATLLSTTGGYDVFLAKYDPSGNLLWNQKMGGTGADHGLGLAIDKDASLYIAGYFASATAEFDPANPGGAGTLALSAAIDIYIAKYDSSGAFVWARAMEGDKQDHAQAIALDGAGNVYITGAIESSFVDFNPGANGGTVINVAAYCPFLAKYTSDGDFVFARGMGGVLGQDWGRGVAVDQSGNVYTTGYFSSHVAEFNRGGIGGVLEGFNSNYDIFLLKLACSDSFAQRLNIITCDTGYILNDSVYSTPGSYVQYFINKAGCDSVIRLELDFYTFTPSISVNEYTLYVSEPFASYQWMKDGQDIGGATDSFYVVTDNADYQVRVTNSAGCEATSAVYTVTNVSVSTLGDYASRIRVSPNPARKTLYISSPVPVSAQISSMEGRLVLMSDQADQIDVSHLTPGIYLLRVLDQQHQLLKTEKLVIE
jgi:hypothetical protein